MTGMLLVVAFDLVHDLPRDGTDGFSGKLGACVHQTAEEAKLRGWGRVGGRKGFGGCEEGGEEDEEEGLG